MSGGSQSPWREVKSQFGPVELAVLVVGAVLGFAGNSLYSKDYATGLDLFAFGVLTAVAILAFEWLRVRADVGLRETIQHLQDELAQQLNDVQTSVEFVGDVDEGPLNGRSNRPGYDQLTAAVMRAEKRIDVIGDYAPPRLIGDDLDDPPANRSEYLLTIEKKLESRLEEPGLPTIHYRRLIQRPRDRFDEATNRDRRSRGIVLTRDDMIGDTQVFEHCRRVLEISNRAQARGQTNVDVDLKMIPFLPNCPSMLLVDQSEVIFTLPTRITTPGDQYSRQGLIGVLAMRDRANGVRLSTPMRQLLARLQPFSTPIIKTDGS